MFVGDGVSLVWLIFQLSSFGFQKEVLGWFRVTGVIWA